MSQSVPLKIRFTFLAPDGNEERLTVKPKGAIPEAYALLMELLVECIPVGVAREIADLHSLEHEGDTTLLLLSQQILNRIRVARQDVNVPWQSLNAKSKETTLTEEEAQRLQVLRRQMQLLYPETL